MDDAADEVHGAHVACGRHAGVALPRPASAGNKPQRQVMCLNIPIIRVWDRRVMAHVHVYIHTARMWPVAATPDLPCFEGSGFRVESMYEYVIKSRGDRSIDSAGEMHGA